MKPLLLSLIPLSKTSQQSIAQACDQLGLELRVAGERNQRPTAVSDVAGQVKVLLTNGSTGLLGTEIDAMPNLALIAALGVGYEGIDLEAAQRRGLPVVNGAGSNAACVADHALGLLLCVIRGVRRLDIACRDGIWRDGLPLFGQLAGKRIGIVGFGAIGSKIAQRVLGCEASVAYHARSRRENSALPYYADLAALADWCDHLVVATPGGAATQHLIDATILAHLRPHGCLINIARGSIVDTAALADALREGRLFGAGLDVYEGEPEPPRALFEFPNVVLTLHTGGSSSEAIAASVDLFVSNLRCLVAGDRLLTPVT
ncbi:MAG: NAD(P)-dependent oxidoreductase [Ideonella sp.]